jgi:hypothetical protein
MIPILPVQLQTVVNQVFKPIFNDWYGGLKDKHYPSHIPNEGAVVKPKDPEDIKDPGNIKDPGDNRVPSNGDTSGFDPTIGWPKPPENPEPHNPIIYTPVPGNPIIPDPIIKDDDPIIIDNDDDIFVPSTPFTITYTEINPVEIDEKEYVKNIYDLYNYYTNELRDVIGKFLRELLAAFFGVETDAQLAFIENKITLSDVEDIDKNLKHIMDAAIRSENIGYNKVSFCENMFPLENTLYHNKSFKTCYELRLRYAQIEKQTDVDRYSSDSNTILRGMKKVYDKKYDTAYINLYKYLNSSVRVLDDTLCTLLDGIKTKYTLIQKGGYNK